MAEANGTWVHNIKFNVIQVGFLLVQTATIVWFFASMDVHMTSGFESLNKQTTKIEATQDKQADEDKVWREKVEADIAELRIRIAVLESKSIR